MKENTNSCRGNKIRDLIILKGDSSRKYKWILKGVGHIYEWQVPKWFSREVEHGQPLSWMLEMIVVPSQILSSWQQAPLLKGAQVQVMSSSETHGRRMGNCVENVFEAILLFNQMALKKVKHLKKKRIMIYNMHNFGTLFGTYVIVYFQKL